MICKFTVDPLDVVREAKVLEDLWHEPAVTGVVGPVKLVKPICQGQHGEKLLRGSVQRTHMHAINS